MYGGQPDGVSHHRGLAGRRARAPWTQIVSALLGPHQRCSVSTGRLRRPPCNPGVGGGSVWRSVHATATAAGAIVEMTSR